MIPIDGRLQHGCTWHFHPRLAESDGRAFAPGTLLPNSMVARATQYRTFPFNIALNEIRDYDRGVGPTFGAYSDNDVSRDTRQ